jgi:IS30 family transposase
VCSDYSKETCTRLLTPPYSCNGCAKRKGCTLEKAVYRAKDADREAARLLREKRSGIDITTDEVARIGDIVSPLIAQGQSPWHIWETNKDEIMVSDKTLYKYIAAGLFSAKSMDLRTKVKMKPRKSRPQAKVDRACRKGRTYRDFIDWTANHPDTEVPQMDTVIGAKGRGEKCLLTILFPKSEALLAFIRDANTAKSVADVFENLKTCLGIDRLQELFPAILTDNGAEFTDPGAIEWDADDGLWITQIFYCDPYAAWQKPHIENSHRLLRFIIPKGTSMNSFDQDDINRALSHINSYRRRSLGGQSPIEVFGKAYGYAVLRSLGIDLIDADKIVLTPDIIKK